MSEKVLQEAILECARLLGWLAYHPFDSRRSQAGFPDLCMVKGDRLIFAELKSRLGRMSVAQLEWFERLRHVPHVESYLWVPDDWLSGDVEAVLRSAVTVGVPSL